MDNDVGLRQNSVFKIKSRMPWLQHINSASGGGGVLYPPDCMMFREMYCITISRNVMICNQFDTVVVI